MTLPDEFDLGALLKEESMSGGTKMVILQTAQAVRVATGMDIKMVWVAEIYRSRRHKPLIRIVDDNPVALLEQLARLATAGNLNIRKLREAR